MCVCSRFFKLQMFKDKLFHMFLHSLYQIFPVCQGLEDRLHLVLTVMTNCRIWNQKECSCFQHVYTGGHQQQQRSSSSRDRVVPVLDTLRSARASQALSHQGSSRSIESSNTSTTSVSLQNCNFRIGYCTRCIFLQQKPHSTRRLGPQYTSMLESGTFPRQTSI